MDEGTKRTTTPVFEYTPESARDRHSPESRRRAEEGHNGGGMRGRWQRTHVYLSKCYHASAPYNTNSKLVDESLANGLT